MKGSVKYNLNFFASIFSAPVIIGALFKILHWPFATEILTIGMLVEAGIFIAMAFQPQYDEVDWSRVYPELLPENEPNKPLANKQNVDRAGIGNTHALDKMLNEANITPELINGLGTGLKTFGDKVSAISNVANTALYTNQFAESLKQGSTVIKDLVTSYQKASASLADMQVSGSDVKAYNQQVSSMVKNLSALNAVYEMELQESNNHLKSMSKYYGNINETMNSFTDTVNATKIYKEEVQKLAKNLTALNAIYGNMLSAMNVSSQRS